MNLFHESKKILDKDGKVNPLGPYGRQKLTGREVSTYFRRNPVKDAQIKKAVEVALDLQGAMTVASKEIKKFYGDKILRSKEVQKALKYANESVEHDIREDLNEAKKLKDIVRKHKSALMKAKRSGNLELPQKVEDELSNWASNNGDIYGDDPDEFIDWLDNNLDDLVPTLKIRESVNENYRKLAQYGMGTETSKSARVGLELDFYDSKGNKQFGKILQKTNTGYLVKDDKGKKHVLKYHDRKKAAKMLKPNYVHTESINEVTDKEINMAKKLSKDMEKVKKGYQQIAKTGDKTLKNTGFNPTYEAILKAQQKVLSLIGELNTMKIMSDRAASRQKDSKGRPIMNSFDAYRHMQNAEHCELVEGKVLKFTKVKDKSLEKHLKVVTKKVGAKLEKISGGFAVSDTDMRGFTAVVDYIFDKSIKKNMLDGGGMSDVTMANESVLKEAKMSKEMPLDVYAKKVGIDKKEQEWIMKNEKAGGMYYNNSMFPSAYSVLSYPIYDKDYYFAFIGDSMRENAKANAEMNRELRRLKGMKATPEQQSKGFKDVDALFAKMYERFGRLSSLGAHDTMTREELSFAVTHIKTGRATNELAYEYDLMKAVDGGTFFEEVSDKKQETFTEGRHGQMLRNIQMKALRRKSKIKGRAGAFESMSHNKLNVMDEYAKMYEDMVQKAREKQRLSDTHKREKEALAKKHARMKEQKELDEGMMDLDKARKLPDNIQKQIVDAKKEYDRTWDGVFVPMGKEGSSQRKEYERRGKLFKAASKKYKDLLKKHKVATFK